jgi:hypothetical protein
VLAKYLDGEDDPSIGTQHNQPQHIPPASTWVSSSVAPSTLGLGIATVATVQDPDVVALSSVQRDPRESHLSASFNTRLGMAAFQDIDSGDGAGSTSKCFRLEESSSSSCYRLCDPESYHFDVECHRGPGPQFLFVQYSFVLHAPIVSGQFLSLPDHLVLSKWSLAPAILGLEWMRQHISSSASHSKAYT